MVLVPAEAALSGGRRPVMRAAAASGIAVVAIGVAELFNLVPPSRLLIAGWEYYVASALVAVVQAALIAAAAQDRQRKADGKQGAVIFELDPLETATLNSLTADWYEKKMRENLDKLAEVLQ